MTPLQYLQYMITYRDVLYIYCLCTHCNRQLPSVRRLAGLSAGCRQIWFTPPRIFRTTVGAACQSAMVGRAWLYLAFIASSANSVVCFITSGLIALATPPSPILSAFAANPPAVKSTLNMASIYTRTDTSSTCVPGVGLSRGHCGARMMSSSAGVSMGARGGGAGGLGLSDEAVVAATRKHDPQVMCRSSIRGTALLSAGGGCNVYFLGNQSLSSRKIHNVDRYEPYPFSDGGMLM